MNKKYFFCLAVLAINISEANFSLLGLENTKSNGHVAFEGRIFKNDHIKSTADESLALQTEINGDFTSSLFDYKLGVLARADQFDKERDFIDFRENYIFFRGNNTALSVGHQIFNWSLMEGFHPADILNSRNYDSNVEEMEKKGELAASLEQNFENVSFGLHYLPHYTSPQFPGEKSRLAPKISPSPMISNQLGKPYWVEGNNIVSGDQWGHQGAAQMRWNIADLEGSFHLIRHMDRSQPLFSLARDYRIHPYYFKVTQIGGNIQLVAGNWIFKYEGGFRDFDNHQMQTITNSFILKPHDHYQSAAGIEKSFATFWGSDLTFFAEHQQIYGVKRKDRVQLNIFQNDLLAGFRNAFNDSMSKEIIVTMIYDLERKNEYLVYTHYSQRLSDLWNVKIGARLFHAPRKGGTPTGLEYYHDNSFIHAKLTRFF